MNIQQILQPRIEALGYKVEDFDEVHYDGFTYLSEANIEITDNLLNPKIDSTTLGLYAGFAAGDYPDCIHVLRYLQPGMLVIHLQLIKQALEAKNEELLAKYVAIFSTPGISSNRSYDMAKLAKMDAPYEHLNNPLYSDEEVHNEKRGVFLGKFSTTAVIQTDKTTGKYYEQK